MNDTIKKLESTISERKNASPESSYVASLFAKGRAKIAQKVGEEATETIIASLGNDPLELTKEAADLIFHLLILLNIVAHRQNIQHQYTEGRSYRQSPIVHGYNGNTHVQAPDKDCQDLKAFSEQIHV